MNHIINSKIFRLYYQSKWTHQWHSSFLNYKYHYNNDIIINKFLKNYFDFYFFNFLKKNKKLLQKKRKLRAYILNNARCFYLNQIRIIRKWGYTHINLDLFIGTADTMFNQYVIVYPTPRKVFRHRQFPFQNVRGRINPLFHFLTYTHRKIDLTIPKYVALKDNLENKPYSKFINKHLRNKNRFRLLVPVFRSTKYKSRRMRNKINRFDLFTHQILKLHILYNLKKLLHMPVTLSFNWLKIPTAKVITRYITRQLKNRHTLNQIIYSFMRDLFKNYRNLKGILIKCTGRITKRQRASCRWFKLGNIYRSNMMTDLDYSHEIAILKYGVTSIKVWLYSEKK